MAKQSGLGQGLYVNGVDVSTDIQAISKLSGGPALLDVTGIDKLARERIGGLRDGTLTLNAFLDPALIHSVLNPITNDNHLMYALGLTIGADAACLIGTQLDYPLTRAASGLVTFGVEHQGDGYGLEYGELLTAGKRTDTSATNGTAFDFGSSYATAATITSNSIANPSVVLTAAPHGLVTGDSVLIAGVSTSSPTINGSWPVTVVDPTHFSVPVNVTVGGTGGTFTKTSTDFGLAAYLQCFAFAGTSVTVKLQHSADNGVADAWADITGAGFTAVTAAPAYQRIQTTTTLPIKEYVRAVTTGTFNPATFAVMFTRHPSGAAG